MSALLFTPAAAHIFLTHITRKTSQLIGINHQCLYFPCLSIIVKVLHLFCDAPNWCPLCSMVQLIQILRPGHECKKPSVCPWGFTDLWVASHRGYPAGQVCRKCVAGCASCGKNATHCLSCEDPLLLHKHQCVEECPPAHTVRDRECQRCPSACQECSPLGQCTGTEAQCKQGEIQLLQLIQPNPQFAFTSL